MEISTSLIRRQTSGPWPPARSRTAAAWLALVLGIFAVAGCGEPVSPPAVSLTMNSTERDLRWPETAGEMPASVEPIVGDPSSVPRGVARLTMSEPENGPDNRMVLLSPPGARYSFRLDLPGRPVFRVGLGYDPPLEGASTRIRFVAMVHDDTRESGFVVLDETITASAGTGWLPREIDLGAWAGRSITLTLSTEGDDGQWAAWAAPEIVSVEGRESGWDVLLVSLDTLRADHLGCYGYDRPTSPQIDRFAGRSVLFTGTVSQSPWTRPSHRALFTGIYPVSRGGLHPQPLAGVLRRNGYRTEALTGGGQLHHQFGFHKGFEVYRTLDWVNKAEEVTRWVKAGMGRKRFLFLHTFEIHDPYTRLHFAEGMPSGRLESSFSKKLWWGLKRRLTVEEKAYAEALYDGGIRHTDEQLGRILGALEELGFLDTSIVVLTSDHGEQFWEHGTWRHGQQVYDHQILVPLILHLPPALREELGVDEGRVITQQVRLVDLYPTLLDLLGVPLPSQVHGMSLRPLLEGRPWQSPLALSEYTNVKDYERKSLRSSRYKLIHSSPKGLLPNGPVDDLYELYDLTRDPMEKENRIEELPDVARRYLSELQAITGGELDPTVEKISPPELDPELEARLRALGYLEPDS